MSKLKIGIIGTGGISYCHIKGYKALSDICEVVACCDIDEDKVIRYAKAHSIPRYYTDCKVMMEKEELDCVSVCTWNSAHKECTIAALNGSAHVICEKPMAMNAAEAEEMLEAATRNNKLLQVGFVRRFGDDADAVKTFTNEGMLGDIYYARAQYLRRSGCPGGWFKNKTFSGGGPLIDLGVHIIDLCKYLAGNPKPVSAYGVTYDNLGPNRAAGASKTWELNCTDEHPYNVEDFASAMIKFDNGFTLQIETSFNLNVKEDSTELVLCGTKAGVSITDKLEMYTDTAGMFVNLVPANDISFRFSESFDAEIKGFVDAVLGKQPCRATAEDGVEMMKIIDAIYESSQAGHSVEIR